MSSMTSSSDDRVPNARFTGVGLVTRCEHGAGDHLGDRADIGEVASLQPVAVHGDRLAGQRGVEKRWYDGGVRVAGRLEWAEHVEEAKRQRWQSRSDSWYASRYDSAVSLLAAYGLLGSVARSSRFGSVGLAP